MMTNFNATSAILSCIFLFWIGSAQAQSTSERDCKSNYFMPLDTSRVVEVEDRSSQRFGVHRIWDIESGEVVDFPTTNHPGRNPITGRFSGPKEHNDQLIWFDRNGFWYTVNPDDGALIFIDQDEENIAASFATEAAMGNDVDRSALAAAHGTQLHKGSYYLRSSADPDVVIIASSNSDRRFTLENWASTSDWLVTETNELWRVKEKGVGERLLQCYVDDEWRTYETFNRPLQLINVSNSSAKDFIEGRGYLLKRINRYARFSPEERRVVKDAALYEAWQLPKCQSGNFLGGNSVTLGEILYSSRSETLYGHYDDGNISLKTDDIRLALIAKWGSWSQSGRVAMFELAENENGWVAVFSFERKNEVSLIKKNESISISTLCKR